MMSYLYPEDEVTFDKSGFGPLPDMLESYAEEEANSYFELYFEYPLFSSHERGDYNQIYVNMSDYLIEGNQVTYKPSHSREPHAFRIYKTEKQVERGIILVWARTRTADLRGNPVRRVASTGTSVDNALRALKLASEETHPFSFTTNIQSNIDFEKTQTNVLDALAGEDDSILAISGGQMIRSNNNIYIGINESSKDIVEFRLGKNIEGISYEVDYSNVVTAVIPFYTQTYKLVDDVRDEIVRDSSGKIVKNSDGTTKYNRTVGKKRESLDNEVIVYGDTVFSQYANDYSTPFYIFVEIRDDREDPGVDKDPLPPFTKADINNRAVDWFEWEENLGIDEPEVYVTVDIHDISQSSEYSHNVNLSKLETLNVFDKALVYVPEVGIDMDMEINYIRYDGVSEKNIEVRLGNAITSLRETMISPQQRDFNQKVQKLDHEIAKTSLSSDGKARIYWMATKPVGEFEIGDLWFDVSLDGGIYVWDGYDWVAKITSDFGKLVEDSVKAAIETAEQAMVDSTAAADEALAKAKADATAKANAIKEQVSGEVNTAISTAETAKQTAIDGYNNAVAEAERLVGVQKTAFDNKFSTIQDSVDTFNQSVSDVDAKTDEALEKAGANANLLTTHQNTLNTIKNTTIPNINKSLSDAMAEAKTALTSASSAMDEAQKADGKIADYVTKNGLVNGTTVDTKINSATGEINKKITTVESKIPTEIGGRRNLFANTTSEPVISGSYQVAIQPITEMPNDMQKVTLSFMYRTSENYDRIGIYIYRFKDGKNKLQITPGTPLKKSPENWSLFTKTFDFDYNGQDFDSLRLYQYPNKSVGEIEYKNLKLEKGTIPTDWSPAPEDNYTQEEFKIFESTYDEDVKGINSTLTELSNKKLDGSTYTTFYDNEYKKTAQGVTDTYAKVNKIIDANGNSTDAFAKAVYDRNATRQSLAFQVLTKDLVKTATYEETAESVERRLTAIDGSEDSSFLTRLNKTESTASGNSKLITTIKDNYVTQKTIDESILSDKQVKDTRNDNQPPSWYYANYPKQTVKEFKVSSVMGVGADTYGLLTTDVQWFDSSGGTIKQQFATSGVVYNRVSNYGGTAWLPWSKQIDTADKTYQKVVERSNLYERVIGSSSEEGVKQNVARAVMTDSLFQTKVYDIDNGVANNLLRNAELKNTDYWNNVLFRLRDGGGNFLIDQQANLWSSFGQEVSVSGGEVISASLDIQLYGADNSSNQFLEIEAFNDEGKQVANRIVKPNISKNWGTLQTLKVEGFKLPDTARKLLFKYYQNGGRINGSFSKPMLNIGYTVKPFSPNMEDKANYSEITELAGNIKLKVSKSDLISQINVQAGGVLIQSGTNKLNITPETTFIKDATIKSAMIDTIDVNKITGINADFTSMVTKALTANTITSTMINANDAMFEKLFANSMATTKLAAQKAWITDANIASLDAGTIKSGTIDSTLIDAQYVVTNGLSANVVKSEHINATVALVDKIFSEEAYIKALTSKSIFANQIKAIEISASKITSGELDGSKASITNIDAKNITANKTSFVQSVWNALNSTISIDGNGIRSANASGDWTLYHSGAVSFGNSSSQGIYLEYAEGDRNGLAINNRGALNTDITLDLRSSARNTINFGRRTDTNGYDFRIDHYQGNKVSFDGRGVSRYTFNVNSDVQSHAISILGHGATSGYNNGSSLSIGMETADGRAKGSRFYFSSNSDLVWLSKDTFNDLKPLAVFDLQFRWGQSGRKSMKAVLERLSKAAGVDINNIPDVV